MLVLPTAMMTLLEAFAGLFTLPSWQHAHVLLTGTIVCQGNRCVSSVLRVLGLAQEKRFEKYHRVLNRAQWNCLLAGKLLLGLLVALLPASAPLLIVVDDTVERRKGKKIKAKGCYRDACRSSDSVIVNCFGLKWLCLMVIIPLPWSTRPWALPFLTLLMPSKEANAKSYRAHKTPIDWTITAIRLVTRWLKRPWVLIGDGGFTCLRLGHACIQHHVTLVSRLRLDAALYDFPPQPQAKQRGRLREKGQRLPSPQQVAQEATARWRSITIAWYGGQPKTLHCLSGQALWYSPGDKPLPIQWVLVKDPQTQRVEAFFSTDLQLTSAKLVEWFILRWNVEVTFEETRAHLGIETQRQWSDKAIARTTPVLMGLFSLISLLAYERGKLSPLPVLSTAWYDKKEEATFSDVLAFVRRAIWSESYFNDSGLEGEFIKIKHQHWDTLLDQLAKAA